MQSIPAAAEFTKAVAKTQRKQEKFSAPTNLGNVKQPSALQILTARDQMQLVKNFPGSMSVPYVTGSNISHLPTSTFRTTGSIAMCS